MLVDDEELAHEYLEELVAEAERARRIDRGFQCLLVLLFGISVYVFNVYLAAAVGVALAILYTSQKLRWSEEAAQRDRLMRRAKRARTTGFAS